MAIDSTAQPPFDDTEIEGVIKFDLHHREAPLLTHQLLPELNSWRNILFKLGLTGQDPARYGGLGYGNMSIRISTSQFIISGSQTGGIRDLEAHHYVLVNHADPEGNRIESEGPIKPSSESMTHAAAYAAYPWIQCVLHVHHPLIWGASDKLGLPSTPREVAYGTVAMASEIKRLARETQGPVIAMKGHTDGLIAIGHSIGATGHALIDLLARSRILESANRQD